MRRPTDWIRRLVVTSKPTTRAGLGRRFLSTGVQGLDKVLRGGYLPGRPTVIRGASGTGKTIFSLLFACGGEDNGGPTVFATFDESPQHLQDYMAAFGRQGRPVTFVDFRPQPDVAVMTGPVELGGMLLRIEHAIQKTGARRLVLDAFDTLFDTFEDKGQIRRDLLRVFQWCAERGITLVATAGESSDYRPSTGIMDYASDCTILLRQEMEDGVMTRLLRILKCRGRRHGTNEYPYLIDHDGISVMPVTETGMSSGAARQRVSTGLKGLDQMLGGKGFWRGSTVMVSGHSGSGKSLLAVSIAAAACERGESVLYFSFEESPQQLTRDVQSTGIRLKPYLRSGNLRIESWRPVERGLEEHVIALINIANEMQPDFVMLDSVSALGDMGGGRAFKNTVLRLCHFLKNAGISAVLTELMPDGAPEGSKLNISSLVDTWIRVHRLQENGVLKRQILVHKSRGTRTSDRVKDYEITSQGLKIHDSGKVDPSRARRGSVRSVK